MSCARYVLVRVMLDPGGVRCGGATWLVLRVSCRGELGDFGRCRRNKLAVGVGVAMQAPTTVWRLGEEHPRPVGKTRIICGLGNEPGEFRDHRKLFSPHHSVGPPCGFTGRRHLGRNTRAFPVPVAPADGRSVHQMAAAAPPASPSAPPIRLTYLARTLSLYPGRTTFVDGHELHVPPPSSSTRCPSRSAGGSASCSYRRSPW